MKHPEWILRETVFALHELLVAEFGGTPGVRDEGLLDSALARPEHLFAYDRSPVPALAAAYTFGLMKNHPFLDGNKRIGFAIGALFLEINGWNLKAGEAQAVVQTLALAVGEIGEKEYAAWLEANSLRV